MNPLLIKWLAGAAVMAALVGFGYHRGSLSAAKELGEMTANYNNCIASAKEAQQEAAKRAAEAAKALEAAKASRPAVRAAVTAIRAADGADKCETARKLIIDTLGAER